MRDRDQPSKAGVITVLWALLLTEVRIEPRAATGDIADGVPQGMDGDHLPGADLGL
jgi:hypothetical protein